MRPISEISAHTSPWIYEPDEYKRVLMDISDMRNLDSKSQKQAWQDKKSLQNLQDYEAKTQQARDTFIAEMLPIAKEGTLDQIKKALQAVRDQIHTLEEHDHFDQLFAHELQLLQKSLWYREGKLQAAQDTFQRQSLTSTKFGFKEYLAKYRRTTSFQTSGEYAQALSGDRSVIPEIKSQPAVTTELVASPTKEEWRYGAEFEAYFDKIAIDEALANEKLRENLLQEIIAAAVENSIQRGLITQQSADQASAQGWQPSEELQKWFADNNTEPAQQAKIIAQDALQTSEHIAQSLIWKSTYQEESLGIIPPHLISELADTQNESLLLRTLKTSAEVVQKILFSNEDPLTYIWDFLARPDNKKALFALLEIHSRATWTKKWQEKSRDTAFFEAYPKASMYVEAQKKKHEEHIIAKENIQQAAYLLSYLGVDMDLVVQSLEARERNGSKPFKSEERAATYLLGSEKKTGVNWWEDIQMLEEKHHILTPITHSLPLSGDNIVFTDQPVTRTYERQMNFTYALHMRIGLDTPSKHLEYNKTRESIEAQHAKKCLSLLEQYHEVRQSFPQDDIAGQIENYKVEDILAEKILAPFALHYARLNQLLGDVTGRDTSVQAPANDFLRSTFLAAGEEQDSGKRIASFGAFMSRLEKWLTTNKMPYENAFIPKPNNVEERMS